MLRQIESVNAEKLDLLRQIQEVTEKWQQAVKENAVLNREILHLRGDRGPMNGDPYSYQNTHSTVHRLPSI